MQDRSGPPFVNLGNVVIAPAEVMGEFVDRDMGHQFGNRHIAPRGPFIKDRAAEEPDDIGTCGLVHAGFFRQGDAFVEAGQFERIYVDFGGKFLGDEVRDAQGHRLSVAAKLLGQGGGLAGDLFDIVTGGGDLIRGSDMDNFGVV